MLNKLIFGLLGIVLLVGPADAACSWAPLTNGSTADADQVMNDLNCLAPIASPSFTGNVGIGTTSAATKLELVTATQTYWNQSVAGTWGNSTTPSSALTITNSYPGGYDPVLLFRQGTNNGGSLGGLKTSGAIGMLGEENWQDSSVADQVSSMYFVLRDSSGVLHERLRIMPSGFVGIGTSAPSQMLDVAGAIRQSNCTTAGTLSTNAAGDIICTSDARLKNIIGTYTGGLNVLGQISPQLFTWKPTRADPKETFVHAGFIAQNVKKTIPQAVARQRNGYYSLDTTAILAASVNAIKELKTENDRQAAEIAQLRLQMKKMQHQMEIQTARN